MSQRIHHSRQVFCACAAMRSPPWRAVPFSVGWRSLKACEYCLAESSLISREHTDSFSEFLRRHWVLVHDPSKLGLIYGSDGIQLLDVDSVFAHEPAADSILSEVAWRPG